MFDFSSNLSREQRLRLLEALKRHPLFDNREGRDLILRDLPAALGDGIQRSDNKTIDLDNIVEAARRWGKLEDGTPALLIVLDNAYYYADTSEAGRALEILRRELTSLNVSLPPSTIASTLTPIERAERYRELKIAIVAKDWQRALLNAKPISSYRDVPQLISQAQEELDQQQRLLEDLSDAYAADDWAAIIRISRQLDPGAPPEVAEWIVQAWRDLPTAEKVLTGHTLPVVAVAPTPNGQQILSASGDTSVRLWDLTTGKALKDFIGHSDWVRAVAVTSDGQLAISGSSDRTLQLWDLVNGHKLRTFTGHTDSVLSVAIRPGGRQAISGSSDKTLRLWDLDTGREIHTFIGHSNRVRSVAVPPNGRQVLSSSWDRTLRLWDLTTGRKLRSFRGHDGSVLAIAVTPDGRYAVSGGDDKTIRLWDLANGQLLRIFAGHKDWVRAVAVTPNGRQILSGSHDGTVRLWDLSTGQELRIFHSSTDSVRTVAVTSDGRMIISAGDDCAVRVWTLPEGLLV